MEKHCRSHDLMERMAQGEKPYSISHQWRGIYSSEEWFMKLMEAKSLVQCLRRGRWATSSIWICWAASPVFAQRAMKRTAHEWWKPLPMNVCWSSAASDNFVPPFFEVLNWESFAVFILDRDIPNLKSMLLSIPGKRHSEMQMRVKQVWQHCL